MIKDIAIATTAWLLMIFGCSAICQLIERALPLWAAASIALGLLWIASGFMVQYMNLERKNILLQGRIDLKEQMIEEILEDE